MVLFFVRHLVPLVYRQQRETYADKRFTSPLACNLVDDWGAVWLAARYIGARRQEQWIEGGNIFAVDEYLFSRVDLMPKHATKIVLDRKSTRLNSSHLGISYA